MSKSYRIKEIAELFDIHPDTLRYYEEQGLIHPKRNKNGYRSYEISHLCQINIIRLLRGINLSTERIATYMKNRTVAQTTQLLEIEQDYITQEIKRLSMVAKQLEQRKEKLHYYSNVKVNAPFIAKRTKRCCYRLDEPSIIESEVDFHLKRLESQHKEIFIGSDLPNMGGVIHMPSDSKKALHYRAVFFWSHHFKKWDWVISQGEYACIYYKGSYENGKDYLAKLLSFVNSEGYRCLGDPLELYHIDIHSTNIIEEFITEIQIQVQ